MPKGKVVLVPFPFDDLTSMKVRPAVCLTGLIGTHSHVVIAFITSQQPDDPVGTDLTLDPSDPRFAATGLRARSVLRLHRLVTITAELIQRELGQFPSSLMREVDQRLTMLFAIKPNQ